ncbi:hypothetical protein C8D92_106121 [Tamilnaduibacter salinus]|uniref:Nuclear transport factor 2 family protein n=1 Tax=Tamilnaduibacter salinus TaxID=1484056 RepID=A0A2U1CVZ3_9GAMM|nr:hypothetical protein [Tamilnaduibacter salinus]PVY75861.1 hypothetical protein C8D92_106121 [Tamilnaduibacter salinus]
MSRILRILFMAFIASVHPVVAETLPDRDALTQKTRAFMGTLSEGDATGAYRSLRPYLGVPATPFDKAAKKADDYARQVRERAGDPVGVSLAREAAIGHDFHRVTWLQKFPAAAVAWQFTFYQPDDGWKLVGISYTTDLESLYRPVTR